MDYTETKDLIYKPKRFIVVKVALIMINMILNIINRFLKFLKTSIIHITQNKQVSMRCAVIILTLIRNIFKKIRLW